MPLSLFPLHLSQSRGLGSHRNGTEYSAGANKLGFLFNVAQIRNIFPGNWKRKTCHTSTTIVHVLFFLTADAKPLHHILNQTSQSVLDAQCTSYKLIKNTESLLFATYRNISAVWYPQASVSLWDSFLESFRYILVWAALAPELLDKYICSAAHMHSNGNNSGTGQFENDSHTSSHTVSMWWAMLALPLCARRGKQANCAKSGMHFLHESTGSHEQWKKDGRC